MIMTKLLITLFKILKSSGYGITDVGRMFNEMFKSNKKHRQGGADKFDIVRFLTFLATLTGIVLVLLGKIELQTLKQLLKILM